MKILYEDNHILVVVKPVNVPVCEDDSKDEDLLNILKKYLKEKYNKPGNVYLGLVHRLDRPVSGVMVFAKTSKAASRLSEQIRRKEFKKEYTAVVMGKIAVSGQYEDKLLKNSKTNITQVDEKGKLSILEYELLKYLVDNQGIALSRDKILNNVWNYDYYGDSRTIDSHIKKIRHKLGKKGKYIETMRGVGYKFEVK